MSPFKKVTAGFWKQANDKSMERGGKREEEKDVKKTEGRSQETGAES